MADVATLVFGQSNAVGHGVTASQLTATYSHLNATYSAVQMSVDIDWPADSVSAPDFTTGWTDLAPFTHANGDFGPELAIGHALDAYSPGTMRVIKSARGSTSLTEWSPGYTAAYSLFDRTKARIDERLAEVPGGCTLGAAVWIQGTNDADTLAEASAYGGRLVHVIRTLRAAYGSCMPFVIQKLHPDCTGAWTPAVRRAQEAIARNLPNVSIYSMDDRTTSLNHFTNADDYAIAGERAGAEVISLLSTTLTQPITGWTCGARS